MQQNGTHGEVSSDDMPLPGAALPNASTDLDDDLSKLEMQLFQLSGTSTEDLPAGDGNAGHGNAQDSAGGTLPGPKRTSTFREQAVSLLETRTGHDESGADGHGDGAKRRRAWFYPALHWGLPPDVDTPQRGAIFLQVWDVVVAVWCLYQGFMVPYSLCFEKIYIVEKGPVQAENEQCLFSDDLAISRDAPFFVTRYLDVLVDSLFILDIVLNFLSARWVLEVEPMEHWFLYKDLNDIARMYLRDTFFMDAIGSVPVQYLDCIPNTSAGQVKLLRLLRMIKLLRLNRLKQLAKALQTKFPTSVYFMTFMQLFVVFFLFAHISACIFFYFAYGMADPFGAEHEQNLYTNGWVFSDGILDDEGEHVPHAAGPWVSSFYWAVTTMSTIGYGDISPATQPERILAMFLMAAGCSFFAWVTGKITQLLTQRPACEDRFEVVIGDLEQFMNARLLPQALRSKIRNYYKVRYPSRRVFDEGNIIHDIESPFLKKDIVLHLFRDLKSLVPLFTLIDEDTRKEICYKLRSIYRMPGRVVTYAGTVPEALYIVRFGKVKSHGLGSRERSLMQGDIFGEMAIMGLTRDGLRCRTTTCKTVVELCELSLDDYHDLLKTRPGLLNILREASKMHLQYLELAYERAEQNISMPGQDDFFDSLRCVNWPDICRLIGDKQRLEKLKEDDASFNEEKIAHLEKGMGKKMLRTSITISFRQLKGDKRLAAGHETKACVVCFWPGPTSSPGRASSCQNETKFFRLSPVTTKLSGNVDIEVRDAVTLPIVSPIDESLASGKFPSLQVKVIQVDEPRRGISREPTHWETLFGSPRDDIASTKDNLPADLSDGSREVKSKVAQKSTVLFEGQLSFKDLIQQSRRGTKNPLSLQLFPVAPRSGSNAEIMLTCSIRRIPQSKYWKKILPLLTSKGASDFFLKKLRTVLEEVQAREDAFSEYMKKERLEYMMSKSEAQNLADDAESELAMEKGAASVEDLLTKLNARMERMEMDTIHHPPDGDALFHSSAHGLGDLFGHEHERTSAAGPEAVGHFKTLLTEIRGLKNSVEDVHRVQQLQSAQIQQLTKDRA